MKKLLIAVIVPLVLLIGCTQIQEETTTTDTTTVKVYLTDRPVRDVEALYVHINEANYHFEFEDSASDVTVDVATTVDLLSLAGTEVEFFGIEDLPVDATLVWIGLDVEDATVVVNGEEHPVEVRSRDVKILINESVEEGAEIVLDFDAAASLRYIPRVDGYLLIPVLKHFMRYRHHNTCYEIYGEVVDSNGDPVDMALIALLPSDESTVLRTTFTKDDGSFVINGVKNGEYVLAVFSSIDILDEDKDLMDIIDASDTALDVTVDGSDVDVGTITLE